MADKKILLGMLALVLAFGMAVVGCGGDDDSGGADTWANVTSMTQLNGTWKGSSSQRDSEGGVTLTATMEMTVTITATNATTGTMSGSQKLTYTYSGIDTATWNEIKKEAQGEAGVTVNDAAHSITISDTFSSKQISLAKDMKGVQINQNGTKLKQPADDEDGSPEMIFTKQ